MLILFSATVANTGEDTKIWGRDAAFYLSCIAPCVFGLVIASVLASILHLKKPERM